MKWAPTTSARSRMLTSPRPPRPWGRPQKPRPASTMCELPAAHWLAAASTVARRAPLCLTTLRRPLGRSGTGRAPLRGGIARGIGARSKVRFPGRAPGRQLVGTGPQRGASPSISSRAGCSSCDRLWTPVAMSAARTAAAGRRSFADVRVVPPPRVVRALHRQEGQLLARSSCSSRAMRARSASCAVISRPASDCSWRCDSCATPTRWSAAPLRPPAAHAADDRPRPVISALCVEDHAQAPDHVPATAVIPARRPRGTGRRSAAAATPIDVPSLRNWRQSNIGR